MQILFLLQQSTQCIYVNKGRRTFNLISRVMARGFAFSLINRSSRGRVKIFLGMLENVVG